MTFTPNPQYGKGGRRLDPVSPEEQAEILRRADQLGEKPAEIGRALKRHRSSIVNQLKKLRARGSDTPTPAAEPETPVAHAAQDEPNPSPASPASPAVGETADMRQELAEMRQQIAAIPDLVKSGVDSALGDRRHQLEVTAQAARRQTFQDLADAASWANADAQADELAGFLEKWENAGRPKAPQPIQQIEVTAT